jgi:hypothetical protein
MKIKSLIAATLFSFCFSGVAFAGSYSNYNDLDHAIDPGIHYDDARITAWASGYVNYNFSPASDPSLDGQYVEGGGVSTEENRNFRTPDNAAGKYDKNVVSLGDLNQDQINDGVAPGEITMTFTSKIKNGAGADFAVFENGFKSWTGGFFAELGYVEVSSNGTDFLRFNSISEQAEGLVGAYGGIDSTEIYNLAGKHANGIGTTFDLEGLAGEQLVLDGLVDLNNIGFVKIIDIPGTGDFVDSEDNPIFDAWETWGSGGFDLTGVGAINTVPVPAAVWLLGSGLVGLAGLRRKSN